MKANKNHWTELSINRMKELIGEGLSGAETAKALQAQFNVKMTRNMVIGKCRRDGIQLTQQRKGSNLVVKAKLKEAQDIKKAQKEQLEAKIVAQKEAVNLMPVSIVRFMENNGGCRAVIGNAPSGEALVCAKPLWKRGKSWCTDHAAVYTVPVKKPLPSARIA